MTFRELLTAVRERLQVTTKGVTLKLSYQYPEWVSFDDPELGLPVYITDDIEVRGFIEMRRAIEEVNLFVSLVCPTGGLQIARETADMNPTMAARVNPTMDESWHDFAISETPLTLPQTEANANKRVIEVPDDSISRQEGGMDYTGRRAIPFTTGGIEIREPTQAIRLRSPPIAATDKGKNKMRSEASSDTDSDDDMVVPVLRTSVDIGEGANMPVRRRLLFGIPEPIEDPNNSSASSQEGEQMPPDDGIHWGRFDQALHDMLNDPENPALLGRDAPPVFNARLVSGVDSALSDVHYEGDEIFVGRVFKSKADCKIKLAIHAINRKFHFKTTRSNTSLLVIQCVGQSCPWRVYAMLLDGTGNFQVRQASLTHTCTVDEQGGTRFKYCFVAYGASVAGYAFMRKVVVVDGTSMKGKYGGCLLSAAAHDGNFQIFPLAFAVVDSENDNAWEWFFQKLSTFVSDCPELVFISDRHASIYTGLRKVYKEAHHAACVVHLWRNIQVLYKTPRLGNLMSAAVRAFTITEFNRLFLQIQTINPACAAYLVDIGFTHWTRAHFKGQRYNIMDSNIAESWNGAIKEAREYPLIMMLEYIRTTVMGWLALRRAKANDEKGTLTPNVRKLVEENYDLSTVLAVRDISELEFQVQDPRGECFTVNLAVGSCSCREYDEIGIPCPHALAASSKVGFPSDAMVAPAYRVPTWRQGFAGKI
ncbi:hypothetical protein BRARA_C00363 [Brassica rapa]|uniref:SWIM-type domain-containing protein n=1 Tax=Brassica campestris TaxID=3711 RepID=A0A397ZT54_BRACM|nr:hypothetical protein BRARA_C00363 [Brassica rapa]